MQAIIRILVALVVLISGASASANPGVQHLSGHGPTDGEFSAWTKVLANGTQMKFYAKYLQPGQKVQFMVQNDTGVYEQFAWKRVDASSLNEDGSYTDLQNHVYFIRTYDLKPGKNRVRILVDGELYWGTKTYSLSEQNPTNNESGFDLALERADDEICKLQEMSIPRTQDPSSVASSFPPTGSKSLTLEGTITVKLVFIEWDDLRGTDDDYDYNKWSAELFGDFYEVMSEGKLDMRLTVEADWISVGSSWKDDVIPAGMEGGSWQSREYLQPFIDKVVAAVDPLTDFSGVDVILFGTPSAETVVDSLHVFSHSGVFARTQEGTIVDMFSLGRRIYDHRESQPGWAQYAHEFGHSLGMPDLRDWTQGQFDVPMYIISPMFGHEIMDNQNAGSRSISGWLKWVQGWLNDDQVTCIDGQAPFREFHQLDWANLLDGQNELVTIKVSDTKLVAIESTRWDSTFDLKTRNKTDGVIVYTIDSTLGHQEGPLRLVSPRDISEYLSDPHIWPDWRVLDVIVGEGESLEVEGVRITNVKSTSTSDVVLIESVGNRTP